MRDAVYVLPPPTSGLVNKVIFSGTHQSVSVDTKSAHFLFFYEIFQYDVHVPLFCLVLLL